MKPFDLVRSEITGYAARHFAQKMSWHRLSLEVTKRCTNRCVHCGNNSSPDNNEAIDKETVFRLIGEARESGVRKIHLWGGEPFVSPHINAIIQEVFRQNLNLMITTNGFWGTTREAAIDKLAAIMKMKPDNLRVFLVLSCDTFHQSYPATPLKRLHNVLSAAHSFSGRSLTVVINRVALRNDQTLADLLRVWSPEHAFTREDFGQGEILLVPLNGSNVPMGLVNSPLYLPLGKETEIDPSIRSSSPVNTKELYGYRHPLFKGVLYVGTSGEVFLDFHHLWEGFFPQGNVFDGSIGSVIEQMEHNRLAKMLATMPFRQFLFPFRKYVNMKPLLERSHSPFELFNRLYAKEKPDHDKTLLLGVARKSLWLRSAARLSLDRPLQVIRAYGDLTDADQLETIFVDPKRNLEERWKAAFAFCALGVDLKEYFEVSTEPLSFRPDTTFIGRGAAAHLGSRQIPAWFFNGNY